jgi:spore coat polysaccharide biosynthesis protein SpsF (cytidylyltransferase family)
MNILALIQARMSSKRLPNKVLLPLSEKTVLEHIYSRLEYCKNLNKIVVATSFYESDKPIVDLCKKNNMNYYQGNLEDVLDRFYQAATLHNADAIVRITGDCPVIDPKIVDELISNYLTSNCDYYSLSGNFPDGLDCQIFKYEALEKSWREAKLLSDREHVGTYIERTSPKLFKIGRLVKFKNLSHYRWTLDEPEDYIFLKEVFSKLYAQDKIFFTGDILNLLDREPNLLKINKNILRNQGYFESIKKERKRGK